MLVFTFSFSNVERLCAWANQSRQGFQFETTQSNFEFCHYPKFTFVSRLKTLFCVQLLRFDSSIKPIVQNAEVHVRNTQTNATKVSCIVEAVSQTHSVSLGPLCETKYIDPLIKLFSSLHSNQLSNSVQTPRFKTVHAKPWNLGKAIAK